MNSALTLRGFRAQNLHWFNQMTRFVELAGAHHLLVRLPSAAAPLAELTPAERAVVSGALSGSSNAELAAARGTSVRTIANQLSSAYAKLGVRSRTALAKKLSAPSGQPNAALRELLTGAWTLVERVESGERRWAIARPRLTPLDPSELRALELRAAGLTLRGIAGELGISEPTASRRVRRGMQKLGVASLPELARVFAECA